MLKTLHTADLYIDLVCKSTRNFCANWSDSILAGSLQTSESALPEIGHSLYVLARNGAYLIIQVEEVAILQQVEEVAIRRVLLQEHIAAELSD